jgi:hypothetical protein
MKLKTKEKKRVVLSPQNGYLLVRQLEAPVIGPLKQRIASECWVFANVLDQADDINEDWVDTNVMFLGQLGIKIVGRNDQDQRENHFLIEAKHIVSCL